MQYGVVESGLEYRFSNLVLKIDLEGVTDIRPRESSCGRLLVGNVPEEGRMIAALVEGNAALDPALQNLYDYTKFHIGLYTTVFTAVVAAIKLGSESARGATKGLMCFALFLFLTAGACGGMIASHVPYVHEQLTAAGNTASMWEVRLSPSLFESLEATVKLWASLEHGFFWLGALSCFVATLIPHKKDAISKGCWVCGRSG